MAVFTNYIRIVVAMSVVLFVSGSVSGMVVDGQLGDWGVTPFVDWTPMAGTAYIVDNWGEPGCRVQPQGGESFDLEAGYSRYDAENLYLAIVTSMPESGTSDPYGRPYRIMPGDIAISLNGVSGYNWGIIGAGPRKGTVVSSPTWSLPHGNIGVPSNGPSTLSGGTQTGQGEAVYVDAGVLESNGSHTYVVEMAIPWTLLNTGSPVSAIAFHYAPTCGNDVLNWGMTVPNVPEPSVIALLAMSVATWPMRRRMR